MLLHFGQYQSYCFVHGFYIDPGGELNTKEIFLVVLRWKKVQVFTIMSSIVLVKI